MRKSKYNASNTHLNFAAGQNDPPGSIRVKLISKKRSQELLSWLGLKVTLDGESKASGVRWYGHVLKKENSDVLRRALDFEVAKRGGRGRPNMTWKRQMEKYIDQIGLKKRDAID